MLYLTLPAYFKRNATHRGKGQVKEQEQGDASIKSIPSVTDVNIIRVPLLRKSYLVRFFQMSTTQTNISSKS